MTKFNPETCHKIIQAIKQGNYQKTAAALAGIDESTYYRWVERGKEAKSGKYCEFYKSIKKAEEFAKAYYLQQIREAAESKKHWQAAAWYLERKHPTEWGRQQTIEIDGKIQSENKTKIEWDLPKDPNLRSKARDLISEIRNTEKTE